jgi:uncharacterized protein (TIGR02453 family)
MHRLDEEGKLVSFSGFSPQGFRFLKQLKRNNRREFFLPRKPIYESLLKDPMEALLIEVRARLLKKVPGLRFDPRRSIHRIYRDIRFSADKSPYKTHIAASPGFLGRQRGVDPCFYLSLAPGEVFVAGGLYMPSSDQLKNTRKAIDENPRAFLRVVQDRRLRRAFVGIQGASLTRPPKGYAADHPLLPYLKMKQFYVHADLGERASYRKDFAAKVATLFLEMVPLLRWLQGAQKRRREE